jgi:hypothetical protein
MSFDLKAHLASILDACATSWKATLAGHADEWFVKPVAANVRSVADICYETLLINQRLARRIRGEEVGPMPGFPPCPEELRTREAMANAMVASVEELLEAVGGDPEREIVMPNGDRETAYSLAEFASSHMYYHLGQVNFVQVQYGDRTFHGL